MEALAIDPPTQVKPQQIAQKIGRRPLDPEDRKKLFNAKLDQKLIDRLQIICARRSVFRNKKFSEGQAISGFIVKAQMPRKPTPKEIAQYLALKPKRGEQIAKLAVTTPPR